MVKYSFFMLQRIFSIISNLILFSKAMRHAFEAKPSEQLNFVAVFLNFLNHSLMPFGFKILNSSIFLCLRMKPASPIISEIMKIRQTNWNDNNIASQALGTPQPC